MFVIHFKLFPTSLSMQHSKCWLMAILEFWRWICSIHSFLTRINSFFFLNIVQFSWKSWHGIWIPLVILTPADQVPRSLCMQSRQQRWQRGHFLATNEAPPCYKHTAESCQVPCGCSHSFSFSQLWRPKISRLFSLYDSQVAKPMNCIRQKGWATITGGYKPGFEPDKGEGW